MKFFFVLLTLSPVVFGDKLAALAGLGNFGALQSHRSTNHNQQFSSFRQQRQLGGGSGAGPDLGAQGGAAVTGSQQSGGFGVQRTVTTQTQSQFGTVPQTSSFVSGQRTQTFGGGSSQYSSGSTSRFGAAGGSTQYNAGAGFGAGGAGGSGGAVTRTQTTRTQVTGGYQQPAVGGIVSNLNTQRGQVGTVGFAGPIGQRRTVTTVTTTQTGGQSGYQAGQFGKTGTTGGSLVSTNRFSQTGVRTGGAAFGSTGTQGSTGTVTNRFSQTGGSAGFGATGVRTGTTGAVTTNRFSQTQTGGSAGFGQTGVRTGGSAGFSQTGVRTGGAAFGSTGTQGSTGTVTNRFSQTGGSAGFGATGVRTGTTGTVTTNRFSQTQTTGGSSGFNQQGGSAGFSQTGVRTGGAAGFSQGGSAGFSQSGVRTGGAAGFSQGGSTASRFGTQTNRFSQGGAVSGGSAGFQQSNAALLEQQRQEFSSNSNSLNPEELDRLRQQLATGDWTEPLGLSSGAFVLFGSIQSSFNCNGLPYGYYADQENECRLFHICHPVVFPDGVQQTFQYSFFCGNQTVFDQSKLTCVHTIDSIPCSESPNYYFRNDEFGQIPLGSNQNQNQYAGK